MAPPTLPDSAYQLDFEGLSELEQLALELVNRARLDPLGEAAQQGTSIGSGVSSDPSQPLAPVAALDAAAQDHSDDMIALNFFAHDNPFDGTSPSDRARAEGYDSGAGENISLRAGFADPTTEAMQLLHHEGLWNSIGHRRNFMNDRWSEVGIGHATGPYTSDGFTFPETSILTQNFGDRGLIYLTGVVIDDGDGDGFYDLGEGQGGVRITAYNDDDVFATSTWAAGGYALALAPGDYTVAFEGGDLDGVVTRTATISDENVKLDVFESDAVAATTPDASPADDNTDEATNEEPTDGGEASDEAPSAAPSPTPSTTPSQPATGGSMAASLGDDVIRGGDGGDRIGGRAGDDTLYGGGASDRISGGDGADSVFGEDGDDIMGGGAGADRLEGGAGDDRIAGGGGADQIFGQDGDDIIGGGAGDDLIEGGDGDDKMAGAAGDDRMFGGDGDDVLAASTGDDFLSGGDGDDRLLGRQGDDVLEGGAGDDILRSGEGVDWLHGGEGDDILSVSDGQSTIFIGERNFGDDAVFGFLPGDDVVEIDASVIASRDEIVISRAGAQRTLVEIGGETGGTLTLYGTPVENVSLDDFRLVEAPSDQSGGVTALDQLSADLAAGAIEADCSAEPMIDDVLPSGPMTEPDGYDGCASPSPTELDPVDLVWADDALVS